MTLKQLIKIRAILSGSQSARQFSLTSSNYEKAVAFRKEVRLSWDQAVDDAIQCIKYESPFPKLRYMTTNKHVNWLGNLEKMDKSDHPLVETARIIFTENNANANQIWGIVTLLVSKLAGYPNTSSWNKKDFDKETGILKDQKKLAEYVEFLGFQNEMHRDGVLNMQHYNKNALNLDNDSHQIYGNKIAILTGDMMLGYPSLQIAKLKNSKVTAIMSSTVCDTADFSFLGECDIQNNVLPSDPIKKLDVQKENPKIFEEVSTDEIDVMLPFKSHDVMGTAEKEWKIRHTLGGASRLGKSCQAALILAKHDEEKQKEAYFMGKHMYLSYRASRDLGIFRSNEIPSNGKFLLISAPLLFHLEKDPSLYEEIRKGSEAIENIDFAKVHEIVRNGSGMEKTKELLSENMSIALNLLYKFPKSESRSAIENLILALEI